MSRLGRALRFVVREGRALQARYARHCRQELAWSRVERGAGVVLRGEPELELHPEASVLLGDGCMLDSSPEGYHLGMFAPTRLVADRPGARIEIGAGSRVHGSCLHAWSLIRLGERCLVAANCQLIDSHGHPVCLEHPEERVRRQDEARPVVLEDDVWLGAGCLVLPGVTIGRGSVIGAGSVVTRDIPAGVVAAGHPARVLRTVQDSEAGAARRAG